MPAQGAPPIDLGPGRFLIQYRDNTGSWAGPVAVFAPDGKSVAASWTEGADVAVALIDTANGQVRWRIAPGFSEGRGMAFAPDGRTLAIGKINRHQAPRPRNQAGNRASLERCRICLHPDLAYSADGRRLVAADAPSLEAWDPVSGQAFGSFRASTREFSSMAISPDGKTYAAAGAGPMSCRPIGLFGMGGVGCGSKGGRIWLWDSVTAGEPRVFKTRGRALAVAFASDGRTLAAARLL